MPARRRLAVALLGAALAALAACSFMTSFDPEGQPCDTGAPPGAECLADAGYACVNGRCTRDAGTP